MAYPLAVPCPVPRDPRGVYAEIISVNILYLINMVQQQQQDRAELQEGVDSCVDNAGSRKNCHAIVDFL